jgi:hypothetical protein
VFNKIRKWIFVLLIIFATTVFLLYFAANAEILSATDSYTSGKDEMYNSYINALEVSSTRYEQPYRGDLVENRLSLEGYRKLMGNRRLEVLYRPEIAGIRVLDKNTGYIWGGLKEDKPDNMNKRWSNIGNSLVTIEYFNKEGIEKSTGLDPDNHEISVSVERDIAMFNVDMKDLGISFKFSMKLKESSIVFSMESKDIKETDEFTIGKLYFIPFMGAVEPEDNVEGYIFLPDGPGALMRFSNSSSYLAAFDKRVYGKDLGIDFLYETNDLKSTRPNDYAYDEQTVHMPVFGMVHGIDQNAWFARILDGEEYASIYAAPNGLMTDYVWIAAKFIFRQKYSQPMARNGVGVHVIQKEPNTYSPKIEYFFLSGDDADYSGMARLYRDILVNEGKLKTVNRTEIADGVNDIPLKLDFIISDIEEGFIFNRKLDITSRHKIDESVEYFRDNGIYNMDLVLIGWQQDGLNGVKKSDISLKNRFGSIETFKSFLQRLEVKAGWVSLFIDPVTSKSSQLNTRRESLISISQSVVSIKRENDNIWLNETFFIKPQTIADRVEKIAGLFVDNGLQRLALGGVGNYLYAEHLKGNEITRDQALSLMENALYKVSSMVKLGLYDGNEYTWKYADSIYDIPMVNSQFLFETDTVPFMQMVLRGSVKYYAPYTNVSFFSRYDLLKHIEYGAYPSFLLTELGNFQLRRTPISEYSSTRYEDWREVIVDNYREINSVLRRVENLRIMDRTIVAKGVVKVEYEGGIFVVVNYSNEPFEINSDIIQPKSAAVLEVRD